MLKHDPLASTETSQSTHEIDCFPFLDTNQADDGNGVHRTIAEAQLVLLLNECIGLNASFDAAIGAWLTTSRGLVTMPVMQPLTSTSIATIKKYPSVR